MLNLHPLLAELVPPLSHLAWSFYGAIRAPGCRFTRLDSLFAWLRSVYLTLVRLLFFHVVGRHRPMAPTPLWSLLVVSLIGGP